MCFFVNGYRFVILVELYEKGCCTFLQNKYIYTGINNIVFTRESTHELTIFMFMWVNSRTIEGNMTDS